MDLGVYSSKLAKEFAIENNIDPENIVPSGKNEKITKNDIKKFLSKGGLLKVRIIVRGLVMMGRYVIILERLIFKEIGIVRNTRIRV